MTSDAHVGLRAALRATSIPAPGSAASSTSSKTPKPKVAADIRRIFNAEDRPHAEAKLALVR